MLQWKANNPKGPVPVCPGEKFLPDPRAGDQLFPEYVSKTCLLIPQAGYASQKMPNPCSPSTQSHIMVAKCLIVHGDKNCSRAWQDTSRCSKALRPLASSLHPVSYSCCPRLHRG